MPVYAKPVFSTEYNVLMCTMLGYRRQNGTTAVCSVSRRFYMIKCDGYILTQEWHPRETAMFFLGVMEANNELSKPRRFLLPLGQEISALFCYEDVDFEEPAYIRKGVTL
jgi:hypothetical protein